MTHPSWGRSPTSYGATRVEQSSQPTGSEKSPMPSLYEICLGIQRHLGMIEGRQEAEAAETRRHLNQQDVALYEIKSRVSELERRPQVHIVDPPRPAPTPAHRALMEAKAFLLAVATIKEWTIGGVLILLFLGGIIEPEIARRWLLGVIGLKQI